jgi:hypothetical protein
MRRRVLSRNLPPGIAGAYTEGERAVAAVIAFEAKRHGFDDLSNAERADKAGTSITVVQNYLHWAKKMKHIRVTYRPHKGRKSDTNIVQIINLEWKEWIKRGPVTGFTKASALKNIDRESCFSSYFIRPKSYEARSESARPP